MNTLKKSLAITTLSMFGVLAFGSITALADEPFLIDPDLQFVIEEPFIPFEPIEPVEPFPDDPYFDDPFIDIYLEAELIEDGKVRLHWTPYEEPDFLWYKIMHSQVIEDPYYPIDPELDYYEDPTRTGYIHEYVPLDENFYSICVITTDDRRGCSNSAYIYKEEMFPEEEPFIPEEELRPEKPPEDEIRPEKPEKIDAEKLEKPGERPGLLKGLGRFIVDNAILVLTIIAVIVAASGFTFAQRRKKRSISKYMNKIDDTYSEYKMKAKRCEAELYRLKDIIDEELKTGKIDDSAYQLLMNRIENYMVDIQKQIVNEKFGGLPASLKDQMFKMMEDGEITEGEFDTIQKLIKRSELSVNEQDSLLQTIKDFKKQDEIMKRKKKG